MENPLLAARPKEGMEFSFVVPQTPTVMSSMQTTPGGSFLSSPALGSLDAFPVNASPAKPMAPTASAGGKGTGRLTMFFRVNGAAVYARGANKVQMDLLDGRSTAEAHRRLVQSAAEEMLFRGYLLQQFAARSLSKLPVNRELQESVQHAW